MWGRRERFEVERRTHGQTQAAAGWHVTATRAAGTLQQEAACDTLRLPSRIADTIEGQTSASGQRARHRRHSAAARLAAEMLYCWSLTASLPCSGSVHVLDKVCTRLKQVGGDERQQAPVCLPNCLAWLSG